MRTHHINMVRLANAQKSMVFVGAIADLNVTAFDDTTAELTFTMPSSSSTISYFRVYVDGVLHTTTADDTIPITITGLTAGTEYDVYVNAVDVNGLEGGDGNEVTFTTFTEEWQAIIDRADTETFDKPILSTQIAANNLIMALKANGSWWSNCDKYCEFAYNDVNCVDFAKINWKDPSGTLITIHGGVIYTTYGYEGNAVDGYIRTHYKPVTNGVYYTQDNACRAFVVYKDRTTNVALTGSLDTISRHLTYNSVTPVIRLNSSTNNISSSIDFSGTGLKSMHRDDATNLRMYNKGTQHLVTSASSSDGLDEEYILFARGLTDFTDIGASNIYIGAGHSQIIKEQYRTDYNAYLTAIGLTPIA